MSESDDAPEPEPAPAPAPEPKPKRDWSTRRKIVAICGAVIGVAGISAGYANQWSYIALPRNPTDFVVDEDQASLECFRAMGPELGSMDGIVDVAIVEIAGQLNDYRLTGTILQETTSGGATTGDWTCWVRYNEQDGLRTTARLNK